MRLTERVNNKRLRVLMRHGIIARPGPRAQNPGTLGSDTRKLPQTLKVRPQDPVQILKVGHPHRSLMNSSFSEYFIFFSYFIFLSVFFLKYQLLVTEINSQH